VISRRKLSVMFGALLLSACGQTTTTTSSVVVQWSLAVEANQEFRARVTLDGKTIYEGPASKGFYLHGELTEAPEEHHAGVCTILEAAADPGVYIFRTGHQVVGGAADFADSPPTPLRAGEQFSGGP